MKYSAVAVGALCSLSTFSGAALAFGYFGGASMTHTLAWFGLGSLKAGLGMFLAMPAVLYKPLKWLIEELW